MKPRSCCFNHGILLQKSPMIITLSIILSICTVLISFHDGPASHGQHVTGAPFDNNQYCTSCHSGGDFRAGITAKLYKANNKVARAYTPGRNYFFIITYKHTKGTPLHGFQTTSATTAGGVNINGWRNNLPAGTANRVVLGHNYVEHTAPFTVDSIILPWKAPAAGTGSVTFYTAGNFVNGNGTRRGDQPLKTSFTVNEAIPAFATTSTETDVLSEKVKPDLNPGMVAYQHSGVTYIRYNNTGDNQTGYVSVNDLQGRIIYTGKVSLNRGNNIFPVQTRSNRGIVVATMTTADGVKTSKKIMLQ